MGKTLKSQGIVGLYRGWAVTCGGAFVYRGGQLGLFSQIMAMNPYKDDKGVFGLVVTFIAATAGRTAVMPFNYPFDTIRHQSNDSKVRSCQGGGHVHDRWLC